MKTLQGYLLRELLFVLSVCALVVCVIVFLGFCFQQLHRGSEFGVLYVVELMPIFLPMVLAYTMPVAALVAGVFVFDRLSAGGELDAMKSSGIHMIRVLVPSALAGLWMTFFSLFLFMEMIPWAHFEIRNKPREMLQEFISVPSSGVKDIKLSNCRIQCDACEKGTFLGVRVVMTDQNTGRISEVYRAKECMLKLVEIDTTAPSLLMILRGVSVEKYKHTEKGDECDVATVVEMPLVVDLSHVLQTRVKTIDDMSAVQVLLLMEPGTVTKYARSRILTELNKRAALSLAPLLFIMLGTLLGATTAVGHKVGGLVVNMTLSCAMVFLVYYPMAVFGEQLGWKEKFNPWLSPWLADSILLVVIAGLLWKLLRR